MADKTLSDLTGATTPLDGTELHYVVQGGNSRKVAGSELWPDAENVAYDNSGSGLTSTNAQDAIDEVALIVNTAAGDMTKSVYDPTNVAGNAFDQDNMVDGTTNKNFTATEKTKLAGIEAAADVTDAGNVGAVLNTTAKGTPIDADRVYGGDSTSSFAPVYATWTQTKAFLKTYFDTLYSAVGSTFTAASTTEVLTGTDSSKGVTPDALAALWEKGADVASAGTFVIGEGGYLHATGTTTITDIDWTTAKNGRTAWVVFDGALTLTHNGTTLQLPGEANIVTVAGDRALFVQDASDNVICLAYVRKNGTPLINGGANQAVVTLVDAATVTVDASLSNSFRWTIGGNRTFANPTNPTDGQVINVRIIQDGTGNRTWTLGSKFKFSGGSPLLSTAASAKDLVSCQYDVTDDTWFCSIMKGMA